jgi:hypothetical protein
MIQHTEEHDRWDPERVGWTFGSIEPPLTPLGSLFFLLNDGLYNTTLKLPRFLNEFYVDH